MMHAHTVHLALGGLLTPCTMCGAQIDGMFISKDAPGDDTVNYGWLAIMAGIVGTILA